MKHAAKKLRGILTVALFTLLVLNAEAAGRRRLVRGRVLTPDGEPLKGAVVQIKSTRTLMIRSYISEKDGKYHFAGLFPGIDYEIFARYRGKSSPTKTISQFDSNRIVTLNLIIEEASR